MIEREFVEQKKKEFQIQEFVSETLKNAGHSHTRLQSAATVSPAKPPPAPSRTAAK
jgi:hypothetical protein